MHHDERHALATVLRCTFCRQQAAAYASLVEKVQSPCWCLLRCPIDK